MYESCRPWPCSLGPAGPNEQLEHQSWTSCLAICTLLWKPYVGVNQCQSFDSAVDCELKAYILYKSKSGGICPSWSQLNLMSSWSTSLGCHVWPFAHCFGNLYGPSLDHFKTKSCQIKIQKQSNKNYKIKCIPIQCDLLYKASLWTQFMRPGPVYGQFMVSVYQIINI